MRAAIYARMSTDKQSDTSPDDQIARCREYAQAQGWHLVEGLVVAEAGISGASRHNRPGLLGLVERVAEWDVLLCFDSSRLARNVEDFGWIQNRLRAAGRCAIEVSTGLGLENVGAKVMGVMHEEYLVKLRADVQRGLRGQFDRKFATGALPYGYRTAPAGAPGEKRDSRIVLVPDHADVVRRIFALYASGSGLRAIAHDLNADGIPSPRGRGWAPSALWELLRNPLYRGEYVWNRSRWVKDHETGRRRRIDRPESEWVRQHDEAWRIVPEALWESAQRHMRSRSHRRAASAAGGRAGSRHLLSGFLECGCCGGSFHALNGRGKFGCAWRKDRGARVCSSSLLIDGQALEQRVLGAIREQILVPDSLAYVVERAMERVREATRPEERGRIERRLAGLEVRMERAVELAVRAGGVEAVARKLAALERERDELQQRLESTPQALDTGALRALVEVRAQDFGAALAAAPEIRKRAMRALLGDRRLEVHADAHRGFRVEGLLAVPLTRETPGVSQTSGRLQAMVAGEGFEPPTSGL